MKEIGEYKALLKRYSMTLEEFEKFKEDNHNNYMIASECNGKILVDVLISMVKA